MDHSKIASPSSGSSVDAAGRGSTAAAARPRSSSALANQNQDGGSANTSSAAAHPAIKCPRCDSVNTKFCYYNNYSQTQPRHFCKSCRRYWTEGGALRNVPVGGGCRKNKRVKHRPLINIGAATGLLNPSSLNIDDTTSNMLARLASTSPYPNFSGGLASDDQLLSIAFSRFQETMRLRQSSDHSSDSAPYLDMSFPALVHKQTSAPFTCSCGMCGSRTHSLHHDGCGGLMNTFEGNLGFGSLPGKVEHDVAMAGFCNSSYGLNSLYHDPTPKMHNMVGTSATATLASIEDQLSSFSDLQHVDAFNRDTSTPIVEQKPCGAMGDAKRNIVTGQLQLHADNVGETLSFIEETKNQTLMQDMDEKPLLSSIATNNELSLMMPIDNNWHQPSLLMNEMLLESHQNNSWIGHPTSRWQDNMHPMAAATSATAAGGAF